MSINHKFKVSDPEEPLGHREVAVRKNLWDWEDRLIGVDLTPENPADKPLIAAYTYGAEGERRIRYLPGRLDAYYSAKDAGSTDRLESILYPNSLITVKTLPLPEGLGMDEIDRLTITKYTKHYYIGSERVASALGHTKHVGMLCEQSGFPEASIITRMNEKVDIASEILAATYDAFDKDLALPQPFYYDTRMLLGCDITPIPRAYAPFWYHPDHLGSSSYITNEDGEINQHMEYLPFGELLVEEHLNSYNSPYKFNAKELDAETGNYYYGARYYDPRLSIFISVDPAATEYPNISPYAYVANNPINAIDPDGKRIYFVAGAGNDPKSQGWNYKGRFKKIWESKGLKDVRLMNVSHADSYRHYSRIPGSTTKVTSKMINKAVNGILKDLKNNPLEDGEQLNLAGYSYGSVLQAHVAIALADEGVKVDNLSLIGSPIPDDSDLMRTLKEYQGSGKIGGIQRIDIEGDNFSNPKSNSQYLKGIYDAAMEGDDHPHFDLARPGAAADKKIGEAADKLKGEGVR